MMDEQNTYRKRTQRLLRQIHALETRQYDGDYEATDILIDLARAVEKAELTDRQAESLRLLYVEDLTQVEVAVRMGVRREVVTITARRAIDNIAEVYEAWAYLDDYTEGNAEGDATK